MMTGSSAWRILIRNCLSHRSHEKVYSEAELSESRYWCGTLVNHVCRSPAKAPLVLGLQAKICTTCRSECNESLFSLSFSSYVDAAKKEEEGGEKRMSSSSLTKVITLTLLQDLKKMHIEIWSFFLFSFFSFFLSASYSCSRFYIFKILLCPRYFFFFHNLFKMKQFYSFWNNFILFGTI